MTTGEKTFGKIPKMSKKILVLGKNGMLGAMVFNYLSKNTLNNVYGTTRKKSIKQNKNTIEFEVDNFLKTPKKYKAIKEFDYIINCIGIIKPYCKDNDPLGIKNAIKVNALFPYSLAEYLNNTNVKVIQIATDCVYSGKKGSYTEEDIHDPEDAYGKTKSLGEVQNKNFLNIRCSILGLGNDKSLLEWFLNQKDNTTLTGFSHHIWNGVTTLQFARLCEKIIEKNYFYNLQKLSLIHNFVPNDSVTKYQLLNIFANVFNKKIKIKQITEKIKVDRTLSTKLLELEKLTGKSTIEKELKLLKNYGK